MNPYHSRSELTNHLITNISDIRALKVCLTLLSIIDDNNPVPVEEHSLIDNETLNRGLYFNKHSIRMGINVALEDRVIIELQKKHPVSTTVYYIACISNWLKTAERLGFETKEHLSEPDQRLELVENPEPREQPINIYRLYENHIGTITPSVSEELKEAETLYPPEWISEAFNIAVTGEKNHWRYINTILSRWKLEGKKNGKFRRHTEATDNNKYIDEYRRLRNRKP